MGKPSMLRQVSQLADQFDRRGESKFDVKMLAKQLNLDKVSDLTKQNIFSTKSKHDFIQSATQFAKYAKNEFHITFIKELRPEHFEKFWNDQSVKTLKDGTKKEWAGTTKGTYLNHLKKFDLFLRVNGYSGFLTEKVLEKAINKIPKGYKSIYNRTDRAKQWKNDEIDNLKQTLNHKYNNVITVLAETGIRAIEMQKIKVKHIDFERKELRLYEIRDKKTIGLGKGGRPRIIPLTDKAIQALKGQIQSQNLTNKNDRIFGNINTNYLRRDIRNYNKKNKLPMRSLHSFRHLYAMNEFRNAYKKLGKQNLSQKDRLTRARQYVSALLGHGKLGELGRTNVTYSYLSSGESASIEKEILQVESESKNE